MIMQRVPVSALVLFLFMDFGFDVMGQSKGPAAVFRPALEEIQSQTRIPIVLPSELPSDLSEKAIKSVSGEVLKDGYFIALYFSEEGSNSSYAAGFGGSTKILQIQDVTNARRVVLSGDRTGIFRPVSCGGSCAPANLWWEQNGVMYQIQITLGSLPEEAQEKILIQTANSTVTAQRE